MQTASAKKVDAPYESIIFGLLLRNVMTVIMIKLETNAFVNTYGAPEGPMGDPMFLRWSDGMGGHGNRLGVRSVQIPNRSKVQDCINFVFYKKIISLKYFDYLKKLFLRS